jgi:SHAQKYF class myb-like DNA-binding protein
LERLASQIPPNQGRWNKAEHCKFLEALKIFGKNWKKVQIHV